MKKILVLMLVIFSWAEGYTQTMLGIELVSGMRMIDKTNSSSRIDRIPGVEVGGNIVGNTNINDYWKVVYRIGTSVDFIYLKEESQMFNDAKSYVRFTSSIFSAGVGCNYTLGSNVNNPISLFVDINGYTRNVVSKGSNNFHGDESIDYIKNIARGTYDQNKPYVLSIKSGLQIDQVLNNNWRIAYRIGFERDVTRSSNLCYIVDRASNERVEIYQECIKPYYVGVNIGVQVLPFIFRK